MDPSVANKIEQFFAAYTLRTLGQDEVLIQAGDDPDGVTYLVSGQVRQCEISDKGNKLVLNTFKPPAFFPMSWALNKTPNQFFFEAATPVTYRQAPAEDVVRFLESNPDVLLDLLRRVYKGTDGLLQRMANLMDGTAQRRILFELLVLCRRFSEQAPDGSYAITIRESELAQNAGLSRETVSRELQKLKAEGMLETRRNTVVIKSMHLLEAALGMAR